MVIIICKQSGVFMNLFKTFEIFLREPLSILKDRIIQIVNINTDMAAKASIGVDLLDSKTQITVVNSEKMYNLLKTVTAKQTAKAAQNLALPMRHGRVVLGQLCKRA